MAQNRKEAVSPPETSAQNPCSAVLSINGLRPYIGDLIRRRPAYSAAHAQATPAPAAATAPPPCAGMPGLWKSTYCAPLAYTHQMRIISPMTTKYLTVPSHLELTILRPNGVTETIRHPQWKQISDSDFGKIRSATRAAGRGEVLSYSNVTMQVEEPAEWAALQAADDLYNAGNRAVYRAMDAKQDAEYADRTPSTKSDM